MLAFPGAAQRQNVAGSVNMSDAPVSPVHRTLGRERGGGRWNGAAYGSRLANRWLTAWRTLSPSEQRRFNRHMEELFCRRFCWKLTDDQIEYVIESVKAGRKPEIARLSQLASIPDDAA